MQIESHGWVSPALGKEMIVAVVGHGGARVVVFPSSGGQHDEWLSRNMHQVLAEHLERGWLQMFLVDSVNHESWHAEQLAPGARAARHLQYDRYLADELLPFTQSQNPNPYVIAAGASMGGYHALCFGLKHPERVARILSMSGLADIRRLTGGVSDEKVYLCNPGEFMRNEHEPQRLAAFLRQDIILAIGEDDRMCADNREFSSMLWAKGIGNALRVWRGWAHDWQYWEQMLRLYIGGHD